MLVSRYEGMHAILLSDQIQMVHVHTPHTTCTYPSYHVYMCYIVHVQTVPTHKTTHKTKWPLHCRTCTHGGLFLLCSLLSLIVVHYACDYSCTCTLLYMHMYIVFACVHVHVPCTMYMYMQLPMICVACA